MIETILCFNSENTLNYELNESSSISFYQNNINKSMGGENQKLFDPNQLTAE